MDGRKSDLHILVVEDDHEICRLLKSAFEDAGYPVTQVHDRVSMLECLERLPIKLITLDIMLGNDDGLALAQETRARHNIPIIMISGLGRPLERVKGLEHGADDYIAKPFHLTEVLWRVERTLNRYYSVSPPIGEADEDLPRFAFDHLYFNPTQRELRIGNGAPILLTPREFQLLRLFIENAGRILSRDEITRALKGTEWSPLERSIDGHVARLRAKLEPSTEFPVFIRSVRGVGYVFAGRVSRP